MEGEFFCQCRKDIKSAYIMNDGRYYVKCISCKKKTQEWINRDSAIKEWNDNN